MNKKTQITLRIIGFAGIIIGGAVVSFGPTKSIKVIGGLLIAVGAAVSSLL